MRTYTLYKSETASANDSAHIDVKFTGEIIGVDWNVNTGTAPTTGDSIQIELSTNSAIQSSNDSNGIISTFSMANATTTSGSAISSGQKWSGPMAFPVKAGDRIYVNTTEGGNATWVYRIVLHVR